MNRLVLVLLGLLAASPAVAQWQVPDHAVPIGRGAGIVGFKSAAPGTSGCPLVSAGASADPAFGCTLSSVITTSMTTPILASAAGIQLKTNGSTVAGNITTGQQFIFGNNTSLATGSPVVEITRNTGTLPQVAAYTPILQVANADATQTSFVMQSFNNGAGAQPLIVYAKARGTAASPASVQSGDVLGGNFAYGYTTTTTPGWVTSAGAGFNFVATDNCTPTVCGARTDIYGTPTGGASVAIAASFGAGVMVGNSGAVDPGLGAILATASIKSNGATSGIGYATGAGGTVTQLTNRNTGVTLNTVSGDIVLFSQINAAVSGATATAFTVTNSAVGATDTVNVVQKSGTDKYLIYVTAVGASSFAIQYFSPGAGTTNEAPVFHFNVIKGVNSYLLKRDFDPASNDNTPAFTQKVA